DALTSEIQETLAFLELRRAAQPCVDRRLSEVRALVDQWGRTGRFKTPRWVAQAIWFRFGTARFDAAQSAGRLALLPGEEQYRFGLIVGNLRDFTEVQRREMWAWSTLRMLQGGPEVLSASDRTQIRVALQDASFSNHLVKVSVGQILAQAKGFGWRSDMKRARQTMGLAWKDGRMRPTICLGIDTPPDQANRAANLIYPLPE
ncbi:MAG TPA: hypothetical protein VNA29_08115, partial [Sphingomicrobium sp.]|nr:hypothetical protein [Sphingomicrobium sp.]